MSQAQLAADLSNDAVAFACAASVVFLFVYVALARGYRSEIGRALLTLDAGLTLALGPAVLHRLIALPVTSLAFSWYYCASIVIVGLATWWRVWFVIKVQWRGRKQPDDQADT